MNLSKFDKFVKLRKWFHKTTKCKYKIQSIFQRFVKLAEYVFEAEGEFGEGTGGRPYSRSSSSS